MEIYTMKKSLFALAATTAFAGAAQAQSSVTVYGIMDMGYIGSNYKQVTAQGASGVSGVNQVTKTVSNAFAAGAEQTNRIGFKGNEDLGGGKSAFFTVEFGLSPMDPNATGSSSAGSVDLNGVQNQAGSAVDNRQSFVGLKDNALGQFAFGRQYTPVFNYGAATSPGQYNNIAGDVFYVAGSTGAQAAGFGNNTGFTNRMSNALTAQTARFAGFQADAIYTLNAKNSSMNPTSTNSSATSGGNVNLTGWGLGVNYTWQKLLANVSYQSISTVITNPQVATAALANLNGASEVGGQLTAAGVLYNAANMKDTQLQAGGTYDFGILKAYAQYINRNIQGLGTDAAGSSSSGTPGQANTLMKRSAQQIGVRSYVTPAIESWASVGNGSYTAPYGSYAANGVSYLNAASPTVKFMGYQLGSNYYLSKRTNLYAIYGQTKSSAPVGNVAGSGNTANQYALGVRHTF
jgi:predicted porin